MTQYVFTMRRMQVGNFTLLENLHQSNMHCVSSPHPISAKGITSGILALIKIISNTTSGRTENALKISHHHTIPTSCGTSTKSNSYQFCCQFSQKAPSAGITSSEIMVNIVVNNYPKCATFRSTLVLFREFTDLEKQEELRSLVSNRLSFVWLRTGL